MTIFSIVMAGLIGTAAMELSMALIHRMGWAKADMDRAIGSLLTRSSENARVPGLIIHATMGIVFAFLYAALVALAPLRTPGAVVVLCLAAGLVHGIVVGLLLAEEVAEHHPLEEYREVSLGVVLAHIAGHVFYGAFVGAALMIMNVKLAYFRDGFSGSSLGEAVGFGAIWIVMFGIPLAFAAYVLGGTLLERVHAQAPHPHDSTRAKRSKAA